MITRAVIITILKCVSNYKLGDRRQRNEDLTFFLKTGLQLHAFHGLSLASSPRTAPA